MLARRRYGNSDLMVSPVAYGAMTIRTDPGLHDGIAPSLLRALERGVTLIDTARVYPGSEEIIARTLKEWRGEKPIFSTKLAPASRETFRFHRPLREAYTAESIAASVEASLRALELDTLDIVHLHQWHYLWTHEPEWFDALAGLKRAGKVRFIAISAQDHEHDALLEVVSRRMVDGVQVIVNLFESRPMASLLPLAEARGVGVIARCVFDSGGLSGALTREDFQSRNFLKHAPYEEYQGRLDALKSAFVPRVAKNLSALALRFVLSLKGVSSVTLGMPDAALVDANLDIAEDGPLPEDVIEDIRRRHVWTKNFYERLV